MQQRGGDPASGAAGGLREFHSGMAARDVSGWVPETTRGERPETQIALMISLKVALGRMAWFARVSSGK